MTIQISEPVGILGVGVEGRASINYLLSIGIMDITALDKNVVDDLPDGVNGCFGEDHMRNLKRFATLFRSPSIRPDHPALVSAGDAGTRVTSAVSFFLENCPAVVVGVTGTLGKGTTSSLIAAMSEAAGYKTHLGGNIGRSPLEFLADVTARDRVVLEISSFQAMDAAASPRVGVVLKTTSEHLDWHTDHSEYLQAKSNLFRHQTEEGVVVFNGDAPASAKIAGAGGPRRLAYAVDDASSVENGIAVRRDGMWWVESGDAQKLPLDFDAVRLPGIFNRENIAAALLAAREIGVPIDIACEVAERFEGLPHRLQFVAEHRGIRYYNDSYATRPDATLGALASFSDAPLAMIMGGSEKYADFSELVSALAEHPTVRHVSLIGATAARLEEAITACVGDNVSVVVYETLEQALNAAHDAVADGGVVLLSPACASFGLFPNYKVRGKRFVDGVKKMENI